MHKSIRYGTVSAVYPDKMTARVVFADQDNMVSGELNILVPNTKNNKDYALPDVGENVVCLFMDNDRTEGFIVGAVYSQNNLPIVNNQDVRAVRFADGTTIEHNRKTGDLRINCTGKFVVNAAQIFLNEE